MPVREARVKELADSRTADPVALAAARAVSTACAAAQTPTNAFGFLLYGAAACAYHSAGLSEAADVYDRLAEEELQRALLSLQAVLVPDEPHPRFHPLELLSFRRGDGPGGDIRLQTTAPPCAHIKEKGPDAVQIIDGNRTFTVVPVVPHSGSDAHVSNQQILPVPFQGTDHALIASFCPFQILLRQNPFSHRLADRGSEQTAAGIFQPVSFHTALIYHLVPAAVR